MLPRINRLKNTKDIKRVFREGKNLKEGFLFLSAAKNGLASARFAIVVSQKISKKAAHRNKIKRRLREAVRGLLPQIKTGLDVVFVVQSDAANKSFKEIQKNAEKILKKAGII